MIIPTEFTVGNATYRIKQFKLLSGCARGRVFYPERNLIQLATHRWAGVHAEPVPMRRRVQVFWHEAVHAILHDMPVKYAYLRDDEQFVEAFAKRMTQVVYSAKLP